MIYFIQGEVTRLIKIGYAQCAIARLTQLQTGSPDKLLILGVILTGERDRHWHSMFEDDRVRGEWFAPSERLLAYIRAYCVAARHQHVNCPLCAKLAGKQTVRVFLPEFSNRTCPCGNSKRHYQRMCDVCFKARRLA